MKKNLDLLKQYLEEVTEHYSENSVRAYRKDVSGFINFKEEQDILTYTSEDVNNYLDSLNKEGTSFKPASVNRVRASIVSFYNFALNHNLIETNPALGAKSYSYKECRSDKIVNRLTQEEAKHLIKSIDLNPITGSFIKKRDILLIKLVIATGIKSNEIISLTINQFDFERNELVIKNSSGVERYLPFPVSLKQDFNSYMEARETVLLGKHSDILFITTNQTKLSTQLTNHSLRKHGEYAGIKRNLNCTTLRNTFCLSLFDAGVSREETSQLLGHCTPSFTGSFYSEYSHRQESASVFDRLDF